MTSEEIATAVSDRDRLGELAYRQAVDEDTGIPSQWRYLSEERRERWRNAAFAVWDAARTTDRALIDQLQRRIIDLERNLADQQQAVQAARAYRAAWMGDEPTGPLPIGNLWQRLAVALDACDRTE